MEFSEKLQYYYIKKRILAIIFSNDFSEYIEICIKDFQGDDRINKHIYIDCLNELFIENQKEGFIDNKTKSELSKIINFLFDVCEQSDLEMIRKINILKYNISLCKEVKNTNFYVNQFKIRDPELPEKIYKNNLIYLTNIIESSIIYDYVIFDSLITDDYENFIANNMEVINSSFFFYTINTYLNELPEIFKYKEFYDKIMYALETNKSIFIEFENKRFKDKRNKKFNINNQRMIKKLDNYANIK